MEADDQGPPPLESKEGTAAQTKEVKVDMTNAPKKEPIKYGIMGSEDIPVDPEAEYLNFVSLRIGEIACLDKCEKTKVIKDLSRHLT